MEPSPTCVRPADLHPTASPCIHPSYFRYSSGDTWLILSTRRNAGKVPRYADRAPHRFNGDAMTNSCPSVRFDVEEAANGRTAAIDMNYFSVDFHFTCTTFV